MSCDSDLRLYSTGHLKGSQLFSKALPEGYWMTASGRRQSAICAGVKPPSLYASMTGSDAEHPLLLITAGR